MRDASNLLVAGSIPAEGATFSGDTLVADLWPNVWILTYFMS